MTTDTILLTRNESPSDKAWMKAAHSSRTAIKLYEFNKLSNATAVKALKGPTNLMTLDHRFDSGDQAKSAVLRAARYLNTDFPGAEGKLKRDYLMVRDAESLYFVGSFSLGKERLQVAGKEAWLVEMFYDLLLKKYKKLPARFPIYMFNTQLNNWCELTMSERSRTDRTKVPKWMRISRPPRPTGNFVGVGGSDITQTIIEELSILLR